MTLWSLGTVSWARMLGCGFSFCPTTYPRGAVEKLNQLLKNKNKPPPACCEAVYGLRLCRVDGSLGRGPAVSMRLQAREVAPAGFACCGAAEGSLGWEQAWQGVRGPREAVSASIPSMGWCWPLEAPVLGP